MLLGCLSSPYPRPFLHSVSGRGPPPPRSTLFPYTTLFRSHRAGERVEVTLAYLRPGAVDPHPARRSEEHTSELQSHSDLVCRVLLENIGARPMTGEAKYGLHPRLQERVCHEAARLDESVVR